VDQALRAFDDWMSSGSLWWLLCLVCALMPAGWLVHELGHGMVGLLRTEGLVEVSVGRRPPWWRGRFGRLLVSFSPFPATNAPAGLARVHARCGRGTKVALLLAGPITEAGCGVLLLLAGGRGGYLLVQIAGALWILDALANLVPFSRSGQRSDGGQLLDTLRASSTDLRTVTASDDLRAGIYARWLVLITDGQGILRDQRRRALLTGAPWMAGLQRVDGRQAFHALCQSALAGWCWREAEQGDTARLRDDALDALHAAKLTGALEPALSRLAAQNLLNTVELGLGSPGSDDESRVRLLTDAFAKLPPELRPDTPPCKQQEIAFRYGVAANDIEQARG
jgi:hypothetical protein